MTESPGDMIRDIILLSWRKQVNERLKMLYMHNIGKVNGRLT